MSDNPFADLQAHEAYMDRLLSRLPCCDRCGEPIQQDKAVYYNNQWICAECEHDFWDDIREDFLEDVTDD